MQVIGLCRFSYPALGGFQVEHETTAEREAFLYDPARMDERFRMFEAFTLPSLRAQTDPGFTFIIVIGDSFPQDYRARLNNLIAGMSQVVIQQHPPGKHRNVMKAAINSQRLPSSLPCLQFRLDDDDAVAVTFVERLRAKAELVENLLVDQRSVALDFNQGYIASPCAEGILAAPVRATYWSPALAMMVAPNADVTVMNFSHHRIWKTMPTVTFTGTDMMLRGFNALNDSRQKSNAKPARLSLLTEEQEQHFRNTYNIDANNVRALYSTA